MTARILRNPLTGAITALAVAVPGGLALAAGASNVTPVHGRLAITTSNVHLTSCAGGFDATAQATINVSSQNPQLAGIMKLRLTEIASAKDNAYVKASGTFLDAKTKVRKGTVKLTGVDHGNDLNGVYVITLDNGGVIVGNSTSHQDTGSSAHGEIGTNSPLPPVNSAVLVSGHC
jgi:hypothetical protein